MKTCLLVLLLALASVTCGAQSSGRDELTTFTVLKNRRQRIASIRVPAGYKEETNSYAEGVFTTLSYPDGSYIVLQIGGMTKVPLFTEPKHRVFERRVFSDRIVRGGTIQNTDLRWREENSQAVFPPTNIGFANVPKDRLKVFERSLRSFARAR
jgi:hypothetical protein